MSPELIRTPSLLKHANGARSLRGLHYRGPAHGLNGWAQRLIAAGAKPVSAGRRLLSLGSGWVELQEDEQRPCVTPFGITLGFLQPRVLAAAARPLGLTVREPAPDVIEVDLSDICGSVIRAVPEA